MKPSDGISYHDTQDIDIFQLARVFELAGRHDLSRDTGRLAKLVGASPFVASAWHRDRLVGFARALSDGVAVAYVCDVAVLEEYRGRGIVRELLVRLLRGRDDLDFVLDVPPGFEEFYAEEGFQAATCLWRRPQKA